MLTACGIVEPAPEQVVWNRTAERIEILHVSDDGARILVQDLDPGLFAALYWGRRADGTCYDFVLVARTTLGRDLGRHVGPFCPDDEWNVIDPAAPPTSST